MFQILIPHGLRDTALFTNTLFVHEHLGTTFVTTYNWLLGEKIDIQSFLTINALKIKNFRLVEKRRTDVLYVDFSSNVFRFQAKCKSGLVKTKDGPGPKKKMLESRFSMKYKKPYRSPGGIQQTIPKFTSMTILNSTS